MTTTTTITDSQITILKAIKVGDVVRFRNKASKGFGVKQIVVAIGGETEFEIVLEVLPVNDKRKTATDSTGTSQSRGHRGVRTAFAFYPHNASATSWEVTSHRPHGCDSCQ